MKARYKIDQSQLSKMDLEIVLSMPLEDWRSLCESIEKKSGWHGESFSGVIGALIAKIDAQTATPFVGTEYGIQAGKEPD